MNFVFGFLLGVLSAYLAMRLMFGVVFKDEKLLNDLLRKLSPDAFNLVRKLVDRETSRRNTLL